MEEDCSLFTGTHRRAVFASLAKGQVSFPVLRGICIGWDGTAEFSHLPCSDVHQVLKPGLVKGPWTQEV